MFSTLGAAKCLLSKSGEQERPLWGRRWKLYLTETGLIEPLRFKKPQNVLFFTKLKHVSHGVWVRVLFGGKPRSSAVPPAPWALSPHSAVPGTPQGGQGWWRDRVGTFPQWAARGRGVSNRTGGTAQPGPRPPAPTNTGHVNCVLSSYTGFDLSRPHYKTVNENYGGTSPTVSFF